MSDEVRYPLHHGELTVAQMRAIIESLPADVTFVDTDGVVRFFTERTRIFRRPAECVGRSVEECHAPGTRPRVAHLMSELISGWRDEAVMLAEKDGRPVHVRYMPVRDAAGACVGVLEIAQWLDELGGE